MFCGFCKVIEGACALKNLFVPHLFIMHIYLSLEKKLFNCISEILVFDGPKLICYAPMIMPIILIPTVIKNSALTMKAALRSFFLFIDRFVSPYEDEESSATIRSTIASTTRSKLRSKKVKGGSCMVYPSIISYSMRVVLVSWLRVSFWMVTGFPVALAKVQAIALLKRQPTCLWVFGWESVCLQISSRMLPVISTVTLLL